MSEQELRGLREWLDKQVAAGKITKSNSSPGAPILLVKKPDGFFRLCLDYRALNKVTVKNRYPLPLMTELRERLNTAKVFTKLDLKNGYHLMRMAVKRMKRRQHSVLGLDCTIGETCRLGYAMHQLRFSQ